jgi:phage/conjugal plasmid C-4 type zinc finger TraR family protein
MDDMDDADRANERAEEFLADSLAEQARRAAHDVASRESCAVCDEPIPLARQIAVPGVETCIDCQTELEQAVRRTGR